MCIYLIELTITLFLVLILNCKIIIQSLQIVVIYRDNEYLQVFLNYTNFSSCVFNTDIRCLNSLIDILMIFPSFHFPNELQYSCSRYEI